MRGVIWKGYNLAPPVFSATPRFQKGAVLINIIRFISSFYFRNHCSLFPLKGSTKTLSSNSEHPTVHEFSSRWVQVLTPLLTIPLLAQPWKPLVCYTSTYFQ